MALRVTAVVLSPFFLLATLVLLWWMYQVGGLAPCGDQAAVLASGQGECILRSAAVKAVGLTAGYLAALAAALAVTFGLVYAIRGSHGPWFAALGSSVVPLTFVAAFSLPVSF